MSTVDPKPMVSSPGDAAVSELNIGAGESCLSQKTYAPRGAYSCERIETTFREVPSVGSLPDTSP